MSVPSSMSVSLRYAAAYLNADVHSTPCTLDLDMCRSQLLMSQYNKRRELKQDEQDDQDEYQPSLPAKNKTC